MYCTNCGRKIIEIDQKICEGCGLGFSEKGENYNPNEQLEIREDKESVEEFNPQLFPPPHLPHPPHPHHPPPRDIHQPPHPPLHHHFHPPTPKPRHRRSH